HRSVSTSRRPSLPPPRTSSERGPSYPCGPYSDTIRPGLARRLPPGLFHGGANMISKAFPYKKQRRRGLGKEMAYVEVGEGDPIGRLHGNPPSSSLWRNVLPPLPRGGRCTPPDLIGMGESDKLPDRGPGSSRFVEHRRYLDALL